MPTMDFVEKALNGLGPGELLVCTEGVMFSGEHAFFRADKMSLCLLFRGGGDSWAVRMLPWRSGGKPHQQVYADEGMVKVDKDDPGKYHGRVLPQGLAEGCRHSPASFVLRLSEIDHWPCLPPSQIIHDMKRMILRFDGDVHPWEGLPGLLLSCRTGSRTGLIDTATFREYRGSPVTVHLDRAYYPFEQCFGRGVLVASGDSRHQGRWMKTSLNALVNYGHGYRIALPAVSRLMKG